MSSRFLSDHDDEDSRTVSLGPGLPAIPERLLLAHAQGEVLFICGAGISISAGLPNFRELVCAVYGTLDSAIHERLRNALRDEHGRLTPDFTGLTHRQTAEIKRFVYEDYDVVLGMLERRLDGDRRTHEDSKVRATVVELLRSPNRWQELAGSMPARSDTAGEDANPPRAALPSEVHRALMRLADRGGAVSTAIATAILQHLSPPLPRRYARAFVLPRLSQPASLASPSAEEFSMRGASPVFSSTSRGAWFIVLSRRLDDEARLGEDRRVVRPARHHLPLRGRHEALVARDHRDPLRLLDGARARQSVLPPAPVVAAAAPRGGPWRFAALGLLRGQPPA